MRAKIASYVKRPWALAAYPGHYGNIYWEYNDYYATSCTHPIQTFPDDLDTSTYPDEHSPGSRRLRARSEVDRRAKYFEPLQHLDQPAQDLLAIIKRCLEDEAKRRPTIDDIVETLKQIRSGSPPLNRFDLLKGVSYYHYVTAWLIKLSINTRLALKEESIKLAIRMLLYTVQREIFMGSNFCAFRG
jgi:hypothetical protein